MPELPEVETMRRGIASVAGLRIASAEFPRGTRRPIAVRLEGSTIGDATYKTADNRSGRFQHRHRVYGREGKACRRCGETIERLVQAQRSTFFCPGCQWHPRRRSRTL
jgi:formamidopyrimidine-DNA glycosylase